METFESWFPDVLTKAIRIVKNVQELLGDIHDCDVWLAMLPVFIEEEQKRATEFYGKPIGIGKLKHGMAQLEKDRAGFRTQRHNELLELWPKMVNSQIWRKFVKTMFAETENKTEQNDNAHEQAPDQNQPAEVSSNTDMDAAANVTGGDSTETTGGRNMEEKK